MEPHVQPSNHIQTITYSTTKTCLSSITPLYVNALSFISETMGPRYRRGQGIRSWLAYHEFKPSITKDAPCRGAMHVKSVASSTVLPLVW
ncbi:hypothetical protein TNCV_52161 [Trichonephila clavipes]|nr:hypothetical protein TNCV_52161 [Trichonephila clavipes]